MRPKRFFARPLFHEHETVGILGVYVDGMREAPRLHSRAQYVLSAEIESFPDAAILCHDAAKYENHSIAPIESSLDTE